MDVGIPQTQSERRESEIVNVDLLFTCQDGGNAVLRVGLEVVRVSPVDADDHTTHRDSAESKGDCGKEAIPGVAEWAAATVTCVVYLQSE